MSNSGKQWHQHETVVPFVAAKISLLGLILYFPLYLRSAKARFSLRKLVFDQSSPVHHFSNFRGGGLSITDGERRRTEILVSYTGYNYAHKHYNRQMLYNMLKNQTRDMQYDMM